jgi:DNA-directed RNA polymerase specialized sigma24 family protein
MTTHYPITHTQLNDLATVTGMSKRQLINLNSILTHYNIFPRHGRTGRYQDDEWYVMVKAAQLIKNGEHRHDALEKALVEKYREGSVKTTMFAAGRMQEAENHKERERERRVANIIARSRVRSIRRLGDKHYDLLVNAMHDPVIHDTVLSRVKKDLYRRLNSGMFATYPWNLYSTLYDLDREYKENYVNRIIDSVEIPTTPTDFHSFEEGIFHRLCDDLGATAERIESSIRKSMRVLTPQQREIIRMKFVDGMRYIDVGRLIGVTTREAPRQRVERAFVILRGHRQIIELRNTLE